MKILKKSVTTDGFEYLDAFQLIENLNEEKSFPIFELGKCVADVLNYYTENTPDAFGDAPYARLQGFMRGFIYGKGMQINEYDEYWDIVKGKRIILRIEVPKSPNSYYELERELKKRK